jgi:hypothetical protein
MMDAWRLTFDRVHPIKGDTQHNQQMAGFGSAICPSHRSRNVSKVLTQPVDNFALPLISLHNPEN